MLRYLIAGVTLGSAAGLSPGPILALLVGQTLRYGLREGIKVSLAPVLTDVPIVTFTLLVLSRFSGSRVILGVIAAVGALYIGWLGIESLRVREVRAVSAGAPHSIRKAMAINFVNPHVYVFWLAAGAPMVLEASRSSVSWAAAFIAGFYLCLCGSKMILAALLHRSRDLLSGAAYLRIVRGLGLALLGFAAWLLWDGARTLAAVRSPGGW